MIALLLACTTAEPEPAEEPTPVEEPAAPTADARAAAEAAAIEKAEGAAAALTGSLKSTLMDAMKGGPGEAVSACADQAQGAAALALIGKRARAGRTSTKLRNPNNAAPEWVAPWLTEHGDGPLADAKPLTEVTEADGVVTARIVRPIAVGALCLACHGDPAAIPPEVTAVLAARYPDDDATGYAEGDLRGAVWAEAAVRVE